MKSRKVKAYNKNKRATIPLEESGSGEEFKEEDSSDDNEDFEMENDSSEEEEVLPITDDEESEEDEEEDLPKLDNWGKRKGIYYNADFVDQDRGKSYREEDSEKANAEREAAIPQLEALLKSQLTDAMIFEDEEAEELQDSQNKLNDEDLSDSEDDNDGTEWEKLEHEKRKYPKLMEFKEEFKQKLTEINDRLAPLIELAKSLNLDDDFSHYIKLKYQNLLHYLLNISFYLYLKNAENVPTNHPVYERIDQFKKIDDKLNKCKNYQKEMNYLIEKLQQNEDVSHIVEELSKRQLQFSKKKSKVSHSKIPKEKKSVTIQLQNNEEKEMELNEEQNNNVDENSEEKRTITYQISKNKGLRPRRKKECRNPRVHNRMKFRKANIRRKGQVKQVVKEIKRYAGEPTGISAHVVRSIKLK